MLVGPQNTLPAMSLLRSTILNNVIMLSSVCEGTKRTFFYFFQPTYGKLSCVAWDNDPGTTVNMQYLVRSTPSTLPFFHGLLRGECGS